VTKSLSDLGHIDAKVIYPLSDFMKRTGLGRHAMPEARRNGLRDIHVGSRAFVRGGDFLEWLNCQ